MFLFMGLLNGYLEYENETYSFDYKKQIKVAHYGPYCPAKKMLEKNIKVK